MDDVLVLLFLCVLAGAIIGAALWLFVLMALTGLLVGLIALIGAVRKRKAEHSKPNDLSRPSG